MANISLKYGNAQASAYAYDSYGVMLGSVLGDYQKGQEFGLLALRLNEKFNDLKLKCQVYTAFAININHWRMPLESDFPLLREAYQAGLEAGDLLWAGYACAGSIFERFAKGNELDSVYEEFERYIHFLEKTKKPHAGYSKDNCAEHFKFKGFNPEQMALG
jgi:predicted ATPase